MSFDLTGPDRENQVRRLASCGLSLFPVDSKKIPGKWKAFQTRPNTEPELCAYGRGTSNLGYATGAHAGIVGVDLDDQAAIEWADQNLPPTTIKVVTAKGEHRLYKHPGGKVSNRADISLPGLTGKIDIRGDGGYLVAPGSRHESGHIYRSVGDWTAEGFANLPDYPSDLLKKPEPAAAPTPAKPKAKTRSGSGRPDRLQRATDYVAAVPGQPEGGRDNAAFELASALLGGFGLSKPVAMPLMQAWNATNSPPLGYACLRQKLDQAEKNAGTNPEYPIGYLLDEDRPFDSSLPPDSVDACEGGAQQFSAAKKSSKKASDKTPEPSQASKLLELTKDWKWLKSDGQCFASMVAQNPDGTMRRDTLRFSRGGVRKKLQHLFLAEHGSSPAQEALTQTYSTLEALAEFEGTEVKVWLRTAADSGRIYVDLCDDLGRCIEVSSAGWKVTTDPPVYFYRNAGMQPLPVPERGGSLEELKQFFNCATEEQFILACAWLVHAYFPKYPHAILAIEGAQGSGKSTQLRIFRSLIDPHAMPFRKAPRAEEDVAMGAFNNWVLGYDNLSEIQPWLSDSLCGVATGSGFAKRRLYSDDEESTVSFLRPVILDGLLGLHGKTDLIDRILRLTLEPIPESERKTEEEIHDDGRWQAARPRILGALMDALSCALRNKGQKRLAKLPRLADFAQFVTDAEDALPWAPGSFMCAFAKAKTDQIESFLEMDPLASAIRTLLDINRSWEGTASDLLERLSRHTTDQGKSLPNRIKLQPKLKLLEPNLRTVGIELSFHKTNSCRKIVLRKCDIPPNPEQPPKQLSQPSLPSQTASNQGFFGDSSPKTTVTEPSPTVTAQASTGPSNGASKAKGDSSKSELSPQLSTGKALSHKDRDSSDGCDGSQGITSGGPLQKLCTDCSAELPPGRQYRCAECIALADQSIENLAMDAKGHSEIARRVATEPTANQIAFDLSADSGEI